MRWCFLILAFTSVIIIHIQVQTFNHTSSTKIIIYIDELILILIWIHLCMQCYWNELQSCVCTLDSIMSETGSVWLPICPNKMLWINCVAMIKCIKRCCRPKWINRKFVICGYEACSRPSVKDNRCGHSHVGICLWVSIFCAPSLVTLAGRWTRTFSPYIQLPQVPPSAYKSLLRLKQYCKNIAMIIAHQAK